MCSNCLNIASDSSVAPRTRETPVKKQWCAVVRLKQHLPGMARLVSGIVCMLCGKLDIQSANRWSLLLWDDAMLLLCTAILTFSGTGAFEQTRTVRALSPSPSFSLSRTYIYSLTHKHTSSPPPTHPHPPGQYTTAGSTLWKCVWTDPNMATLDGRFSKIT